MKVMINIQDLKERFYWKFVPGEVIAVKWPSGWVVLHEDADGGKVSTESADPNDHYRPWLEKNVGRQGIDWQWRVAESFWEIEDLTILHIKFRKGKAKYATIAALMWTK